MKNKKILLVDDDPLIITILKEKLKLLNQNVEILTALNYKDGIKHIIENKNEILSAILDLSLPDAPNGELIDYSLGKRIPTIVLTGYYNEAVKSRLLQDDLLDYIFKDGKKGINNSIKSINRILSNYDTTVLVVDDSRIQRDLLKEFLESIKLNVLTANDGLEALQIMNENNQHISLVLTDYTMPNMDGMQLISELRDNFDKDELAIIVMSSSDKPDIATKFIKLGANDFITKPYTKTEVLTRVNSTLDIIDLFKQTREMTFKDFMTGAYNRRYFYSSGVAIYDKAKRENKDIAVAMLDIDNFKKINDTYGHDIGDVCIIKVVQILQDNLRASDLIARFGGEEFVVLLENITKEKIQIIFEKIRKIFEENEIISEDKIIKFTLSIGICYGMKDTIDKMLKISDDALYYCKENGRNQVLIKE